MKFIFSYILFFMLMFPLLVNSQTINQINITDSILCNGDPECIDIDLSNYSKGIYNLTIKTSDGLSNHKLILQ